MANATTMFEHQSQRDAFTKGVQRVADDRVSKSVGGSAGIEFEKARAIEAALAGSSFFTPHAIGWDGESGRIEFDFIEGTRRLQDIFETAAQDRGSNEAFAWNVEAAELLALMHRRLALPQFSRWPIPDRLAGDIKHAHLPRESDVFLHCDYSPVNLLVNDGGMLFVIDAAPNDYFTQRADLIGPGYVDVATYTARLYWPFRGRALTFKWRGFARQLRNDFVEAYEKAMGRALDRRVLRAFERAVLRARVNWKVDSRVVRFLAISSGSMLLPRD